MKSRPSFAPWLVAGMAVFLCLAYQSLVVHGSYGGNWSGLFYGGTRFAPPPALAKLTYLHPGNGYDAQFYRYAAHDPLLRQGYAAYFDDPALRYRRILLPAVASLANPLGPIAVDAAYLALVLAALGAGVWFTAALLEAWGLSAWWGMLFLALPGSIASIERVLLDGPLCAAVAAFLYLQYRGRPTAMIIVCLLAAMTRETGLLLAAAGAGSALIERRPRLAIGFAASTVPFLLWSGYVASRTPESTFQNIVSRPVWGLLARLLELRTMPGWSPPVTALIQALDVLAILGLLAAIALGIRAGIRLWPSSPALLGLLFCMLALVLGAPSHLLDPFGFLRPVSPLLLCVSLEALRGRRWLGLVPLAMTSLAVLPGPVVMLLRSVAVVRG